MIKRWRIKVNSRVFFRHPYLLNDFFEEEQPRIKRRPEKMLIWAQGFSSGETVLIKIALDIWSGSGNTYVWELLESLDKENFFHVLEGLVISRRNRY